MNRTLKRLLSFTLTVSILFSLFMCMSITVSAASGKHGNLSWSYSDGTLTISGTGEMQEVASSQYPWYAYGDSIKTVIIKSGVTSIAPRAFFMYRGSRVDLPLSVRTIGHRAFYSWGNTDVYYEGSLEDRRALLTIDEWNHGLANSIATWHYSPHSHQWTLQSTTSATCTANGARNYSCHCGQSYRQTIDMLGHNYSGNKSYNWTQTASGYTVTATVYCTRNSNHYIVETVDAVCQVITDSTCTVDGQGEYTATFVDSNFTTQTKTLPIEKLGHTEVVNEAVEATCTETGLTEGKHCSVCGEVLITQEVVDALGHTEVIDAAVATTCTETGLTEGKHCSVCNEILIGQIVVDALGHSYSEWLETKVPTCTEKGSERRDCSRCDHYETRDVAANGHAHTAVVTAPTCTKQGYTTHTCHCGDSYADTYVNALGHTEVVDNAVTPTCTETGLTEGKHCFACDEVLVAQTVVDALGHDYEAVVVDPTFARPGYTEYTCTRCGDSYQDTETDPIGLPTPEVEAENDTVSGKPVISWEDDGEADYYEVYRSTSKTKNYKCIGTTENTSYLDESASAGKTYYYKVKAIHTADESLNSSLSDYRSAKCLYPQAEITEVTTNSSGYPTVKWGKVKGAKKYEVWYATEATGQYKKLTTTSSASYTYSKAKRDTEYFFKVRAYGSSSSYAGAFSEVVSGYRTLARPSISLSTSQSGRKVTITWKKISNANGYELQCSINGGEFVTVAEGNILKFVHTDLAPGNEYTYRLRAISDREETYSRYSSTKSSTIKVGKPVVSITLAESGKPQLTWDVVEGAVEYQIYYATSKKGSYKRVETTEALSFLYEAAKSGKTCYFKVRAVDINGNKGDYSSYVKIKSN